MSTTLKEISLSKMRWKLFLLGAFKIPMIGFLRPKLILLDDDRVEVIIRLNRRSKNHLNSMYFGALAVGADIAAGIQAFYFTERSGGKVSLAFKGMQGEFHKRAESNVVFRSEQGAEILNALEVSKKNQERVNLPIKVLAFDTNEECIATFEMILSVRVRS